MLLSRKWVAVGFVEAMDTGAAFDAAFSVIVHWDHNWQLHATELPPINTPFGSAWETNGFAVEPRHGWPVRGPLPVPLWHAIRSLLATIALRDGRAPAYHATLARGVAVAILLRTVFVTGVGMLIVLPILAMNNSMDTLLAHGRTSGHQSVSPAWLDRLDDAGSRALTRLGILKFEIHADMCSHGPQRYCVGGACLTLPRDGSERL
jgi:hypothetical protein